LGVGIRVLLAPERVKTSRGSGGIERSRGTRVQGSIRPMVDTVGVGLLGCGNVGGAVVRLLHDHSEDIGEP
jgi:hypothetical protein